MNKTNKFQHYHTFLTEENIQLIRDKYKIGYSGYEAFRNEKDDRKMNFETIKFIYDNFDFLFLERTKFDVYSYGAKHYVERFRCFMSRKDGYVSNGELIVALILRGIKFEITENNPNLNFKCSYRSEIRYLLDNDKNLTNHYFSNSQT